MTTSKTTLTETQKTALNVYAMVAAGSVLMLIPVSIVPFAGLACLMVGFIAAYVYRARNREDGLMVSHMGYVIRTVWWSSLILLAGLVVFTSVLMANGDTSMITDLMKQAEKGIIPTEADVRAMQALFVQTNADLIIMTAAVTLLPYPLYLAFRMVSGVRKAVAGGEA